MSKWLLNLDAFFTRRQPFVVATVASYHGSSPDLPGACVFYSERNAVNLISSGYKQQLILKTAKTVLSNRTRYLLEKIPLGEIAASDNGHCDVLYEFFRATEYPQWLKLLKYNHKNKIDALVVSEFGEDSQAGVTTTNVVTDFNSYTAADIGSFLLTNGECQLVSNNGGPILLRKVFNTNIPLTIIGSHPIAALIVNTVKTLPVNLQQIQTPDCQIENLNQIPSGSYVVIMTGDHTLDYRCCQSMLKRSDLAFVGCIGSERKAQLFKQKLRDEGLKKDQSSRLSMPVGLKEINGKQKSVVAASIIAQILSLHEWRGSGN